MDPIEYLTTVFPDLERGTIEDVLLSQRGDVNKAIDELLNLAAGDDLFARSVMQEKLSVSQNLRNFDSQQEKILQECQENKRKQLEQQRRQAEKEEREREERQRKQEEDRQKKLIQEERAREEKLRLEVELRAKEEERQREEHKKQEQEQAARSNAERAAAQKALEEERQRLAQERAEMEETRRQMEEKLRLSEQQLKERDSLEAERKQMAEEKARIEEERKRIAEEEARIAQEKEDLLKANQAPPKFSIYTRKQQAESQDDLAQEMRTLLVNNGFDDKEIITIDVSQDVELASFLKNICKNSDNIKYPIVCAGNLPIGTIDEVRALVENPDKLEQLKKGEYVPEHLTDEQRLSLTDGTGVFVGQGVLDHCLDAAEYVISGVGSLLWLPVTLVTYPFRSEQETLQKAADDVDFDIVHTNWYWRNLKRRFRFTKDGILRIHPTCGDVRASHPYSSIFSVKIVNDTNFVINYRDGSSPDYVTSTPQASSSMLELMKIRCADTGAKAPVFFNESEL